MSPVRWGLALSGWAALAAVAFLPEAYVPRVIVTAAFLLACPGLAAVRWARPAWAGQRAVIVETAVLALVVSMSLSVLVAEALFLSGTFSVRRTLLALAVPTSVLALLPQRRGSRDRTRRAAPDQAPATTDAERVKPPPRQEDAARTVDAPHKSAEGVASALAAVAFAARRLAAAMMAGTRG
ncbi:hypothetical protein [Streptomyces canus]|uniref:hypothetical protein n=1 Tax=Streptomyces canus TaxID=58343 RepID=UPI0036E702F1